MRLSLHWQLVVVVLCFAWHARLDGKQAEGEWTESLNRMRAINDSASLSKGDLNFLVGKLSSPNPSLALAAFRTLRNFPDPSTVDLARKRLADADTPTDLRAWCAALILQHDSSDRGGLQYINRTLESDSRDTLSAALQALSGIGPVGRKFIPKLMKLYEKDRSLRGKILTALKGIGPGARPQLPFLISRLGKDSGLETDILFAVGEIGVIPDEFVPAILVYLRDPKETTFTKQAAMHALKNTPKKLVVEELEKLVDKAQNETLRAGLRDLLGTLRMKQAMDWRYLAEYPEFEAPLEE